MWKSVWMCLSIPVQAVCTGKYNGMPVSRNPFQWLGMLFWGILLIPFTIFVYPLAMLLTWLGVTSIVRNGNDATISDSGLEVFSKKSGIVGCYDWSEIDAVEERFDPPVLYPELFLRNGHRVKLHLADRRAILDACKEHDIRVKGRGYRA